VGHGTRGFDGSDEPTHGSGADSPAPVPPHERTWRHPSEIGFATVIALDSEPLDIGRNGRRLVGLASVVGVVVGVALVMALRPDSLHSDPHDVVALTNSRLRVASIESGRIPDRVQTPPSQISGSPVVTPPRPPVSIEMPALSIGSRLVDTMRSVSEAVSAVTRPTEPPESTTTVPVTTGTATRAMGVLSESGDHLLTTMAAVSGVESIDVRLPDGTMVRARILHTLPELHIAVLAVSDEATTGARADIKASGLGTEGADFGAGQPVMVLIETPREFVIGSPVDDIVVSLETYGTSSFDVNAIAEGAPLVSRTGHLIGLCTHSAGRFGFVPMNILESALTRMLNVDVDGTTTLPQQ
jgi:hypothetical protein